MFARRTLCVLITFAVACAAARLRASGESEGPTGPDKVRVGVYNSRSVALAFLRSDKNKGSIDRLMAEGQQAKAHDDKGRLKVLEKKADALQNLHHMQVFGNAPILDIIGELKDVLEKQAKSEKLDLIVRDIDITFHKDTVELVDITSALVESCQPTKETLKMIEQMKQHSPVPLEQFPIEHEHGDQSEPTSNPTAEADALSAAQEWLKLIDAGSYEDSWKNASTHFRAVVPRDRWLGEMSGLRKPLGKVINRAVVSSVYSTELPDAPLGEYVVIRFKTSFENDKEAFETVTPVREVDGTWKVDGYYIR